MKKHIAAVLTAGALWGLMGLFTRSLAQFGISSTGAIKKGDGYYEKDVCFRFMFRNARHAADRLRRRLCQ